MVNPAELVVLGTSAPIALKVLGPTADYVGNELQSWTQRRVENVQRIFEKAEQRLGDRIEEPGQVPPRVLREVLEEGSYLDDELGTEYFGGLLAASRSEMPLDDRAAALAGLVGRLSTFQLRTHYILYANAQSLLAGTGLELVLVHEIQKKGRVFVPYESLLRGLGSAAAPTDFDWDSVIQHSLMGLFREGLIAEAFVLGAADFLEQHHRFEFPSSGLIFNPTLLGVELFCSAHGVDKPVLSFLDPEVEFQMNMEFPLVLEGSTLLHELPPKDKKTTAP